MQTTYLGSVEHADGYNGATAIAYVCIDSDHSLIAVYPHGFHHISPTDKRAVAALRGFRRVA